MVILSGGAGWGLGWNLDLKGVKSTDTAAHNRKAGLRWGSHLVTVGSPRSASPRAGRGVRPYTGLFPATWGYVRPSKGRDLALSSLRTGLLF